MCAPEMRAPERHTLECSCRRCTPQCALCISHAPTPLCTFGLHKPRRHALAGMCAPGHRMHSSRGRALLSSCFVVPSVVLLSTGPKLCFWVECAWEACLAKDAYTPRHGMCSSRECALFNVHFVAKRKALWHASSYV